MTGSSRPRATAPAVTLGWAVVGVVLLAVAFAVGWRLGLRTPPPPGASAPGLTAGETVPVTAGETGPIPNPPGATAAGPAAPSVPPELPAAAPGARLAIILDDCGQNLNHLDEVLALPFPVTLSILPRQTYSLATAQRARAAGKPFMLHQPMAAEGTPAPDPGPGALTVGLPAAAVEVLLADNLAGAGDPPGFNNHMGSQATADRALMRIVMGFAKARGLFFIDSWTSGKSVALAEAQAAGIPAARRDVFLDNQDDYGYIRGQLTIAARRAAGGREVIAIGHLTRQQTWRVLRDSADWLRASGIALVPAADLAH